MRFASKILGAAVALAVVMLVASSAWASLVIEIRQAGAAEPGGGVLVNPGDTVDYEIWAVVIDDSTGHHAGTGGLTSVYAGAKSSNGGFVLGDMAATVNPNLPYTLMFRDAPSYDQDGDGDLDVGQPGVGGSGDMGWMYWSINILMGKTHTEMVENMIGTGHFTADGAFAADFDQGPSGVVRIEPVVPENLVAQWGEPGNSYAYGVPEANGGIFLYAQSTAKVEGAGAGPMLVTDEIILDATTSTGSINWWGWYFDPSKDPTVDDPDFVTEDGLLQITEGELLAFGYNELEIIPGAVKVGWANSDPINTDIATFELIVPEPATIALLGLGTLALVRRKK